MFHLMNLRTAVVFAVRAGMVGLISFSIAFHRLEAYSRRELIPFFSGSVPAGDSGSEEQSAYALIGNTVNVASRIQGLTRELVNRIQNLRKDKGLEVTDRIHLTIEKSEDTFSAFEQFKDYICSETLAQITFSDHLEGNSIEQVDLVDGIRAKLKIEKIEY